ncbi:MAG: hypothetical protein B7733_04435 [Myxococcales bacterium FL481]|nr:MAG: hypothetical protein B7733_04435 [Myxococcales bacterium FL481]
MTRHFNRTHPDLPESQAVRARREVAPGRRMWVFPSASWTELDDRLGGPASIRISDLYFAREREGFDHGTAGAMVLNKRNGDF